VEVDSPQPVAVEWMVAGYAMDARRATALLAHEQVDAACLQGVHGLLGTFVRWHPFIDKGSETTHSLVALGVVSFQHLDRGGHWREILAWWPVLEEVANDYSDFRTHAELRVQRATIQNYCGQLDEVAACYRDYLETSEFCDLSDALRARILLQAGICSLRLGQSPRAAALLGRSLTLAEQCDAQIQVCALNQLGNLSMSEGQYAEAEQFYLQCLARAQEIKCANIVSVARCSLGRLYTVFAGRPRDAIHYLSQNLAVPLHIIGIDGAAESAVCLAMAYAECDRLREAWQLACQTLLTFRDLDNSSGIALCRVVLGRVQQKQGHSADAILHSADAILHWCVALDVLKQAQIPMIELYVLRLLVGEYLHAYRIADLIGILLHILMLLFRLGPKSFVLFRHLITF
jgi:tetratricopeptide (TPR) repeat protein